MDGHIHKVDNANVRLNTHFSSKHKFRIAFWVSERKAKRLKYDELHKSFSSCGMDLVLVDTHTPISHLGQFHAVIHKIIEHLIKSEKGCSQSKAIINDFENYIQKHPEVVIIDPLTSLRRITDRSQQYSLIDECGLTQQNIVCVPAFVSLTSSNVEKNMERLNAADVQFPFVCKPLMADGTNQAHQMALVFNEEGLKDISPPCVAQTFINHNALLFKIFVLGQKYYIVERPSLKNFTRKDQKTIFFSTDEVSKADSKSSLTQLDDVDNCLKTPKLDNDKLDMIVRVISKNLKLSLYGLDIIVEKDTDRHAIIDMNPFPSYDGMTNFPQLFADYVLDKIKHQQAEINSNNSNAFPV